MTYTYLVENNPTSFLKVASAPNAKTLG